MWRPHERHYKTPTTTTQKQLNFPPFFSLSVIITEHPLTMMLHNAQWHRRPPTIWKVEVCPRRQTYPTSGELRPGWIQHIVVVELGLEKEIHIRKLDY